MLKARKELIWNNIIKYLYIYNIDDNDFKKENLRNVNLDNKNNILWFFKDNWQILKLKKDWLNSAYDILELPMGWFYQITTDWLAQKWIVFNTFNWIWYTNKKKYWKISWKVIFNKVIWFNNQISMPNL